MANDQISKPENKPAAEIGIAEAELIWDEYKYRHDLIWKHLIRSTVAVIGLITISYSTSFDENTTLFILAALLAVVYTGFTFYILNSELALYENIKFIHRRRQSELYKMFTDDELVGNFSARARIFLVGLFVLALAAAVTHILPF